MGDNKFVEGKINQIKKQQLILSLLREGKITPEGKSVLKMKPQKKINHSKYPRYFVIHTVKDKGVDIDEVHGFMTLKRARQFVIDNFQEDMKNQGQHLTEEERKSLKEHFENTLQSSKPHYQIAGSYKGDDGKLNYFIARSEFQMELAREISRERDFTPREEEKKPKKEYVVTHHPAIYIEPEKKKKKSKNSDGKEVPSPKGPRWNYPKWGGREDGQENGRDFER